MEACRAVAKIIKDDFDEEFQREYGQLAVAIGGALPTLSEGRELQQYQGGAAVPRVQRGSVQSANAGFGRTRTEPLDLSMTVALKIIGLDR
jgi:hypothetical protein